MSLSRTQADWFSWGRVADFFLRPPTLTASNFEATWPKDPKFWALKDLNLFLKRVKFQCTGSILRLGFARSKWPHFNRAYLVTVCKPKLIAVYFQKIKVWVKTRYDFLYCKGWNSSLKKILQRRQWLWREIHILLFLTKRKMKVFLNAKPNILLHLWQKRNPPLLHKPYWNEVTLNGDKIH